MRIVSGANKELLIITNDNDVCAFVGCKPECDDQLNSAIGKKAMIADGIIAACVEFAASLQRATSARQ